MVFWARPVYMDETIKENLSVLRHRFKYKKFPGKYYFIILPKGNDRPEIIHSVFLKQPWYKSLDYTIIGIAENKQAALEMLCQLISETYEALGDLNVRRYLMQQGRIRHSLEE